MSSSATVNMDSMLSDFSTSLLGAADADKKRKKEKVNWADDGKFLDKDNRNLSGNFNLNGVLSKIRDNGSAYVDTIKQNTRKENKISATIRPDKKLENSYAENRQNKDYSQDEDMEDDQLHLTSKKSPEVKLLHYVTRAQLLSLISLSAVIVGVAMYMLDSYVNNSIHETSQSVNASNPAIYYDAEDNMEGKILRTPDEIMLTEILPADTNELTFITSSVNVLTGEVRSLRQELEQLKETIKLDKLNKETVKNDTESIVKEVAVKEPETSINNSIAKVVATGNFKSLKNNSKSKVDIVETKTKLVKRTSAVEIVSKKSKSTLTVNLVSLSNKTKANEIVESLEITGLSPRIEEAIVNGTQIYRISVAGFADKDEAKLFIQNATNKFGVKGSRIRQN